MNEIICGDALIELKKFGDNSFDSIVTDPPAGIEFMGKEWDSFKKKKRNKGWATQGRDGGNGFGGFGKVLRPAFCSQTKEDRLNFMEWLAAIMTEGLRVLKPGGHALVWALPRTSHWTAWALEMAGFEIKDVIHHIFATGFPKNLNISLNINKGIDNLIEMIYNCDVWKRYLSDAKIVETKFLKNQIEVGTYIPIEDFAQGNAHQNINLKKLNVSVLIAEKYFSEVLPLLQDIRGFFVVENVEQNIQQLKQHVKYAEKKSLKKCPVLNNQNIYIVEGNVKELLKESIMNKIKGEEAQKIWLGKWLSLKETDIDANFVELIEILKHTILKELKNIPNYDTIFPMELLIATNVIITESTMVCLISSMADILKEINKQYCNFGTAIKPAVEYWILARKSLTEKTIAKNILKWGTGGLNISRCRIPLNGEKNPSGSAKRVYKSNMFTEEKIYGDNKITPDKGRYPSHLIHDGSPEVLELFPDSKTKRIEKPSDCAVGGNTSFDAMRGNRPARGYNGDGSAARFFYCAKPSRSERDRGLEGIDNVIQKYVSNRRCKICGHQEVSGSPCKCKNPEWEIVSKPRMGKNSHPCVKSLALMRYLIKLITPPGGAVLDFFCGSGSTLVAAKELGFNFMGIDNETEYCETARSRVKAVKG